MKPWMRQEFRGRRVYVIGLGSKGTGRACAHVLVPMGARVTVADVKPAAELADQLGRIEGLEVGLELGDQAYATIEDSELIVLSPGVPPTVDPVVRARRQGIPVVSEIEIASWLSPAPIIAVTGTKGKTTTTTLIGLIAESGGRRARIGGNIGSPLIEHAAVAAPDDLLVAEVSSFQLEMIDQFRPHVAVVLNFSFDHLDRHPTLQEYWAAKRRIFENQQPADWAVLNFDDGQVRGLAGELTSQVAPFSLQEKVGGGVAIHRGQVALSRRLAPGAPAGDAWVPVFPVEAVRLRGRHNLENVLAAVTTAAVVGIPLTRAGEALSSFTGVPNRLEEIAVIDGVTFVNDSQATTPTAVIRALEAFEEPILLIIGGRPKVSNFKSLARVTVGRAKRVFAIGEAADRLEEDLREAGFYAIDRPQDLPEAVRWAHSMAQSGDVVLLSPACASFDMFRNMEHRGEVFRDAVAALKSTANAEAINASG